jgi:hypothetical protein
MVDKVEDELPLLGAAITLAITAHGLETSDKEFSLNPMVSLFDGEDMWSAVFVVKLDTSQEVFRDFNPKDCVQTGLRTVLL